jgi:serine/threonine protein kinase
LETFSFSYISPEQTGRTNQVVGNSKKNPISIKISSLDYRTDFYSAGVTFFELLIGRLPFESTSRMELLHSHLAREAPQLCDLDPAHISLCLSRIIAKMMAKSPDDRYQSAEGIEQDLLHCKSCMLTEGHNPDHYNFVPGRYDVSRVFKIPLKLYGRNEELVTLMHSFQQAQLKKVKEFLCVF